MVGSWLVQNDARVIFRALSKFQLHLATVLTYNVCRNSPHTGDLRQSIRTSWKLTLCDSQGLLRFEVSRGWRCQLSCDLRHNVTLVGCCQCLGRMCCVLLLWRWKWYLGNHLQEKYVISICGAERGGNRFLQNVGEQLHNMCHHNPENL
jgi:hypothetical protein